MVDIDFQMEDVYLNLNLWPYIYAVCPPPSFWDKRAAYLNSNLN